MENEYLNLPDDPEEAFAVLHHRKFSEFEADWEESDGRGNYLHCARKYIDIMIVCDEVYNQTRSRTVTDSPLSFVILPPKSPPPWH